MIKIPFNFSQRFSILLYLINIFHQFHRSVACNDLSRYYIFQEIADISRLLFATRSSFAVVIFLYRNLTYRSQRRSGCITDKQTYIEKEAQFLLCHRVVGDASKKKKPSFLHSTKTLKIATFKHVYPIDTKNLSLLTNS